MGAFVIIELTAAWDNVPFREAGTTARDRCVMRHKHGVAAKPRLLAVVFGMSGRQTLVDEVLRVLQDKRQAFLIDVGTIWPPQMKTTAKG